MERIGRYEIRSEIGRGGFGVVYRAYDPTVGRHVAVKVLTAVHDAAMVSRFRAEATTVGNLQHKNIVNLFECGEQDGAPYLVMEYMEGSDLQQILRSGAPLTLFEKIDIMTGVAEGLQYAHEHEVIHRDIKPANIMRLIDGTVKIMDFGIARVTRDNGQRLTQTGYMVGSVNYMSPEQFKGAQLDELCDIWAYGVVFYELITGHHPFATNDTAALMYRITLEEPIPVDTQAPECPEDIAQIVAAWTGVPVSRLVEEESARLLRMEDELHKRMVGQDEAIKTVSQSVRRARAGLKDPRRPIGSFIFLGPTGIGKTELARALAEYLFDSEDALIKLDMSEFMERHTTARLVGSPPGYVGYDEGGQLTEAVRRRPYSVILFDEIEKAHPEVFNMLLQILEDGRLSDAKGKIVNFANTVIIMTSNLGIRDVNQAGTSLGFQPAVVDEADEVERRHKNTKEKIDEELKRMFRPEFLNRVDAVVVFKSLTTQQIRLIVDLQLVRLSKHLAEQQITIEVTDAAKDLLAKEGYDRVYGARPLRRVITNRIEDQLSENLLRGKIARGDTVLIDVEGEDGLKFTPVKHRHKEPAGTGAAAKP